MWGEALGLELSCFSGIKFPMCVCFETGSDCSLGYFGSHYVEQACLKSACLCFCGTEIKGMSHRAQLSFPL